MSSRMTTGLLTRQISDFPSALFFVRAIIAFGVLFYPLSIFLRNLLDTVCLEGEALKFMFEHGHLNTVVFRGLYIQPFGLPAHIGNFLAAFSVAVCLMTLFHVLLSVRKVSRFKHIAFLSFAGAFVLTPLFLPYAGDNVDLLGRTRLFIRLFTDIPEMLTGQSTALHIDMLANGAAVTLLCLFLVPREENRGLVAVSSSSSIWLSIAALYTAFFAFATMFGLFVACATPSRNAIDRPVFSAALSMFFLLLAFFLYKRNNMARLLFLATGPLSSVIFAASFSNFLWRDDVPYTFVMAVPYAVLCFFITRGASLQACGVENKTWRERGGLLLLLCAVSMLVAHATLAVAGPTPTHYGGNNVLGAWIAKNQSLNDLVVRFVVCDVLFLHYIIAFVTIFIPCKPPTSNRV